MTQEKKRSASTFDREQRKEGHRPSSVTAHHERHCSSQTCHGARYAVERAFTLGSFFAYHDALELDLRTRVHRPVQKPSAEADHTTDLD